MPFRTPLRIPRARVRGHAAAAGRGRGRALGSMPRSEFLTDAFELVAMKPHNQEHQCQQNKTCPEPIIKIFSQPGLNEIDEAALEANRIRMSSIWPKRRPPRDCERR